MSKETPPSHDRPQQDRREFLKKAGTATATAPAVALLLTAHSKQAAAGGVVDVIEDGYARVAR